VARLCSQAPFSLRLALCHTSPPTCTLVIEQPARAQVLLPELGPPSFSRALV